MIKNTKNNNNLDLLFELVKTSFMLKYNNSVLGFVWVLLKPFMQFVIMYVVFSNFAKGTDIKNYQLYLLIGLITFSFVQEGIMSGVNALLDKAHIILKVSFDKTLAIYSTLALSLVNLSINFLVIIVFALFSDINTNIFAVIYIIVIIVILSIGLAGVAFFTSIISVRIRDLQHIVEVAMQLLFYATPILYSINILPDNIERFIRYSPIYIVIQAIRNAFIDGHITFVKELSIITVLALGLYIAGYFFFRKGVKKIAEFF